MVHMFKSSIKTYSQLPVTDPMLDLEQIAEMLQLAKDAGHNRGWIQIPVDFDKTLIGAPSFVPYGLGQALWDQSLTPYHNRIREEKLHAQLLESNFRVQSAFLMLQQSIMTSEAKTNQPQEVTCQVPIPPLPFALARDLDCSLEASSAFFRRKTRRPQPPDLLPPMSTIEKRENCDMGQNDFNILTWIEIANIVVPAPCSSSSTSWNMRTNK